METHRHIFQISTDLTLTFPDCYFCHVSYAECKEWNCSLKDSRDSEVEEDVSGDWYLCGFLWSVETWWVGRVCVSV